MNNLHKDSPNHLPQLGFMVGFAAVAGSALVFLNSQMPTQPAQGVASQAQSVQPAQEAASQAQQRKADLENSVRSDCYQFLRSGLYKQGTLRVQESWVNGDVNSDFVVIQPFSAENGYGQRLSGTAVCSGSQGVVTSREVDVR